MSIKERLVWRMTPDAPGGEMVVVGDQAASTPAAAPVAGEGDPPRRELSEAGWLGSSFDLLNGVEITEDADSVPGDVFETLFPQPDRRS